MAAKYARKPKLSKRRPRAAKQAEPATRTKANRVLAQGVGQVTGSAFGKKSNTEGYSLKCWDATLPHHLPLPRAVGPYTTIRVTKRFGSQSNNVLFGAFRILSTSASNAGEWTNICAVESAVGGTAINAPANTFRHSMPFAPAAFGSSALTAVPSALTLQVMNPNSLNETNGIIYGAVMNTQAKIVDRTETWDSYFDNYIAFQAPRLMSAGKLALRGVKCNSYPLSMSQLSEFTPMFIGGDGPTTLATATNVAEPAGLAPLLVHNPGGVNLEYLVTMEFRVRFDLLNPASAGHIHHPISSDQTWDKLMRQAVALGNGFVDIADTVANIGVAAGRVAALI